MGMHSVKMLLLWFHESPSYLAAVFIYFPGIRCKIWRKIVFSFDLSTKSSMQPLEISAYYVNICTKTIEDIAIAKQQYLPCYSTYAKTHLAAFWYNETHARYEDHLPLPVLLQQKIIYLAWVW